MASKSLFVATPGMNAQTIKLHLISNGRLIVVVAQRFLSRPRPVGWNHRREPGLCARDTRSRKRQTEIDGSTNQADKPGASPHRLLVKKSTRLVEFSSKPSQPLRAIKEAQNCEPLATESSGEKRKRAVSLSVFRKQSKRIA